MTSLLIQRNTLLLETCKLASSTIWIMQKHKQAAPRTPPQTTPDCDTVLPRSACNFVTGGRRPQTVIYGAPSVWRFLYEHLEICDSGLLSALSTTFQAQQVFLLDAGCRLLEGLIISGLLWRGVTSCPTASPSSVVIRWPGSRSTYHQLLPKAFASSVSSWEPEIPRRPPQPQPSFGSHPSCPLVALGPAARCAGALVPRSRSCSAT